MKRDEASFYVYETSRGDFLVYTPEQHLTAYRDNIVNCTPVYAAAPPPPATDARNLTLDEQRIMRAALRASCKVVGTIPPATDVREELRVLMLKQKTTEARNTYRDGFASGLCYAIERIDRALAAAPPPPDARAALSLVRMSLGWQYLSEETRTVITEALK